MTKNEFNARAAAALTTLAETEGGWSPRTHLMLGLKLELNEYTLFESVLVRAGMVTTTKEVVTITQDGRRLAAEIEAAIAKKKTG